MNRWLCKIFGHRLETSWHDKPTLWCSRCRTIRWQYSRGLILRGDETPVELRRLGITPEETK